MDTADWLHWVRSAEAVLVALASAGIISTLVGHWLAAWSKCADARTRRRVLLAALGRQLTAIQPQAQSVSEGCAFAILPHTLTALPYLLDGHTLNPRREQELINQLLELEMQAAIRSEISRASMSAMFAAAQSAPEHQAFLARLEMASRERFYQARAQVLEIIRRDRRAAEELERYRSTLPQRR